jgi:hypothetical protein
MVRKRTQAQRDAINARAAAYPRPLSPTQLGALRELAKGSLHHWREGYGLRIERVWPSRTIAAIEARGLCKVKFAAATITAAGKRELARGHRS